MHRRTRALRWLVFVLAATTASCGVAQLLVEAPTKELRPESSPPPAQGPTLVILGVDGLRRDIFVEELESGRLPGFTRFLGGEEDAPLAHAYGHEQTLAPFPSVTAPGWSAIATGEPGSRNGVVGNEMLLRPEGRFVAPVPMSVSDRGDVLATFNDQLFGDLLGVPTLYQQLHEEGLRSWVATNQVHSGADRLLLPGADDLIEGFAQTLLTHAGVASDEARYSEIDDGTFDTVLDQLKNAEALPHVLMVYATGVDLLAHVAAERPVGEVERDYLRAQLDRRVGQLADVLARYPAGHRVLVADHGHTSVEHDDAHTLGDEGEGAPHVAALEEAGFAVAEPALGPVEGPADAVIAAQSGCAFLYLADRSRCDPDCSWAHPPRYEEDVLAAADAWHASMTDGALAGHASVVLVRRPRPFDRDAGAFGVYLGDGLIIPIEEHRLAAERPAMALGERLHHLAVGPLGHRAGDVILVAEVGSDSAHHFYFAHAPYQSTHGSAIESDSRVPFFVAHPQRTADDLRTQVRAAVGDTAFLHELAPLLRHLALNPGARRSGPPTDR